MIERNPSRVYLPVSQAFVEVGAIVSQGEVVGRNRALMHASIGGRVLSVATRPRFAGEAAPGLHVEVKGDDRVAADRRLQPLVDSASDAIIRRCADAGVVGLGGGGFPTADKLTAASGRVHTLVVNLMESDAGNGADAYLARHEPVMMLRGAELALKAVSAERIIIAAPSALAEALASETTHTVSTPSVAEPAGEERRLLRGLFGTSIEQTDTPIDRGYLVLNAATCKAIADAVDEGKVLTHRFVRVDDTVMHLPIGTPISSLVTVRENLWRSGSAIAGERLHPDACIGKTSYAISRDARPESAPCTRCGLCRDVCPEPLLPDELIWWRQDNERMKALSLDRCLECGLCDSVCPSDIRLTDVLRDGKRRVRAERSQKREAELALARVNARNARLAERALVDENRREARLARLAKRREGSASNASTEP